MGVLGCLKAKIKPFLLMMQVISSWSASYYLKYPTVLKAPVLVDFNAVMRLFMKITDIFALNFLEAVGTLKCAVGTIDEFIMLIGGFVTLFIFLAVSSVLVV